MREFFCRKTKGYIDSHRFLQGMRLWTEWWLLNPTTWHEVAALGQPFSTPSILFTISNHLLYQSLHNSAWVLMSSWFFSYLATVQDNGCCHCSWQAAKCSSCSTLRTDRKLHLRSSSATPSSPEHPSANFSSPKTGLSDRMTTPAMAQTLRLSPRGDLKRGDDPDRGRTTRIREIYLLLNVLLLFFTRNIQRNPVIC